jgi:hypothetical protein
MNWYKQAEIQVGSKGTYLVGREQVPVSITGQEEVQGVMYWVGVDTSSHRKMYIYTPSNFTPESF